MNTASLSLISALVLISSMLWHACWPDEPEKMYLRMPNEVFENVRVTARVKRLRDYLIIVALNGIIHNNYKYEDLTTELSNV